MSDGERDARARNGLKQYDVLFNMLVHPKYAHTCCCRNNARYKSEHVQIHNLFNKDFLDKRFL